MLSIASGVDEIEYCERIQEDSKQCKKCFFARTDKCVWCGHQREEEKEEKEWSETLKVDYLNQRYFSFGANDNMLIVQMDKDQNLNFQVKEHL